MEAMCANYIFSRIKTNTYWAGKFAAERIAPLNRQGDEAGATLKDGEIHMPEGWRDVYRQWCEAGWGGLPGPDDYGGQGLPVMVSMAVSEMWHPLGSTPRSNRDHSQFR